MAESRVLYGPVGDQSRLIPAPLINISKNYQRTGSGEIIGKTYSITVTGTIVAHMGSPMSDGTFHKTGGYPADENIDADDRLHAIMRKQQALRELFQLQGGQFEIYSGSGYSTLRFYPRVVSIDFPEDIWFERSNYTITLECDEIYGIDDDEEFADYIENATEEWSIDTNEDPQSLGESTTYSLSHSISATGKTVYDETGTQTVEPWQYAERYVLARLGFDSVMALSSGVNNLPSYYNGWNHRRANQVDKKGGGYSVTETWLLASGNAIESFDINIADDLESPQTRVTIRGTITGFEERDSNMTIVTSKWDNAQPKFVWASGIAHTRAQQYSGLDTINIEPLSMTIGKNPLQGTIDYTFEYDTRPMTLIEGAKSETITVSNNIGGELFASVFVLGRTLGPVLQDLGTKPENTRSLSLEVVVDPPRYTDRSIATITEVLIDSSPSQIAPFADSIDNLIYAVSPERQGFTTVFQSQPQESWDAKSGRFSYNCTWTFE